MNNLQSQGMMLFSKLDPQLYMSVLLLETEVLTVILWEIRTILENCFVQKELSILIQVRLETLYKPPGRVQEQIPGGFHGRACRNHFSLQVFIKPLTWLTLEC